MNTKIQYTNQTDRQTILDANTNKTLIEEQNLFTGNFLIFSDTPRIEDNLVDLLAACYATMVKQTLITSDKIKNPKIKSKVDAIVTNGTL